MTVLTLKRNLLGKIFGKVRKIELNETGVTIFKRGGIKRVITFNTIIDLPSINTTLIGGTFSIQTSMKNHVVWCTSEKTRTAFIAKLTEYSSSYLQKNIIKNIEFFKEESQHNYLRDSSAHIIEANFSAYINSYRNSQKKWDQHISRAVIEKLIALSPFIPITQHLKTIRADFITKTLNSRKAFYDGIESNKLTNEQRLAVITNNDKNLVLAAAGTGKTSVMVAKALDIINHDKVSAQNVLLLAYNNAAAIELKQRLELRKSVYGLTCESPTIITFHKLGLAIIKQAGISSCISVFAQDPIQLERWFSEWLITYISKNTLAMKLFIELAYLPSNPFEFKTQDSYQIHVRDNEFRSINNEPAKSYQEALIANWLFLHSVDYTYKGPYRFKRRIKPNFDYAPSFHITGTSIYLEHFCITRDGSTRPDIDQVKYKDEMHSKRAIHKACGTTLLETYHYDWVENNLDKQLTQLFKQENIPLKKKTNEEVLATLKGSGFLLSNIKRYIKCLQAIRVEQLNKVNITKRLECANITNAVLYGDFLHEILVAYKAELKRQNAIDFDDMIVIANKAIETGQVVPQWTDILVDEFQDISATRMNLINNLINKGQRPRLTVVGDDWQSIYRFSGGKLNLITQFEKYNGSHSLTTLQKTFRYNNSIANTAGKFVMQNPEQYKKNIITHDQVAQSQVYLLDSTKDQLNDRIHQVIDKIRRNDTCGSIAILARYRYLLNEADKYLSNAKINSNTHYWTLHGAKGLEADYCIIIGLFRGKNGFPSVNKEEDVVEALLPIVDKYKYSEERRLLYVGLTRAKKKSYLIADPMAPSEFITELLTSDYDLHIASDKFQNEYQQTFKCPSCTHGYLRLNKGKYGNYYECTSGRACEIKSRVCIKCGAPSVDTDSGSQCQSVTCEHTLKTCIKCGRLMKLREGKNGSFWGCTGFAAKADQCNYTE